MSVLSIFLIGSLFGTIHVAEGEASGTIYVRADGSIDPPTAPIERNGSIYTLTDNISIDAYMEHGIVVERNNTVIDGAGFVIQGIGGMGGIYLSGVTNTTIRNIEIKAFWHGIWLKNSTSNSIYGNNITVNEGPGVYFEASNGSSIFENAIANNGVQGIMLLYSFFNSIYGNNITASGNRGVQLGGSGNNNISGNEISDCGSTAIMLIGSSNNVVSLNEIVNNEGGIDISSNNTISKNNITGNGMGIDLGGANNILRENTMTRNGRNFGVYGGRFNDVDVSNLVDGKPIYYWCDKHDMTIPLDAGYVALTNCSNITVQNLALRNNTQGISLAYTENSTMLNNHIVNNTYGIFLRASSNNCISQNNLTANNSDGIWFTDSSYNNLFRNYVAHSHIGLNLYSSSCNQFSMNDVISNDIGIWFFSNTRNNTLHHNNFINNTHQVEFYWCEHNSFWDDGYPSGGNYWSNYTGVDSDHDGIGDSPLILNANNADNYPLMGMFSNFNATSEWYVQTVCNSTISEFNHNGTAISFNVAGENGSAGFCRIRIPTALMSEYQVFVNGTEVDYDLLPISNSTHSYLYFAYDHSTKEVVIIPEFPSLILLPLFLLGTLLATVFYRRKITKSDMLKISK